MKKVFMVVIILIAVVFLGGGYFVYQQYFATLPSPTPVPKESQSEHFQIQPGVGMGSVNLGMSKQELISFLGQPNVDDNGTLKYFSRGLEIFVTREKVKIIFGMNAVPASQRRGFNNFDQFTGTTSEGIAISSPQTDVEKMYGKPDLVQKNQNETQYVYHRLGINFAFDREEKVSLIMVYLPKD